MKAQNHVHLQEEQILWAIIDEKELAGDCQQHLLECPACRRKAEHFRDELQELGQKARQAVPPFSRPVRLPAGKPAAVIRHSGWLPFFGTAAVAGLLVFFYFMGMETMAPTQLTTLQSPESLREDESLMREISQILDVSLPEDLYAIGGDNGTGFTAGLYETTGDNGTGVAEDIYEISGDNGTEDLYDDITGDNGTGFDEDFLEFVVPGMQDDFQSELII